MSRQVSQTPARFPSGVNNSLVGNDPRSLWRNYGAPDPTRYQTFHNDFYTYAAGDYTITQTGGTAALAAGAGGWLALTASTGGTDSIFMQHAAVSWYPEASAQIWFEARVKFDAVTTGNAIIGLVATDTTPLTNTDGVYFIKSTAGTGVLSFVVNGSSTATTVTTATTAVADTFVRLGFYVNPRDATVEYYIDGVKTGASVNTNLVAASGLALTMGIAATSAASRVLTVDYVTIAKERFWASNPTI